MKIALDEIFERHELFSESLIAVLQDIQEHYHYLSEESIHEVAAKLNIPISQAFSVATFYNAFSLT